VHQERLREIDPQVGEVIVGLNRGVVEKLGKKVLDRNVGSSVTS
jgi:hypothetical protein